MTNQETLGPRSDYCKHSFTDHRLLGTTLVACLKREMVEYWDGIYMNEMCANCEYFEMNTKETNND